MKGKILFSVLLLVACTALAPAAEAACRYEEPRSAAVSAEGATLVRIEASAGSLEVVGVPGSAVRASGSACVSDRDYLRETTLTATRRGSVVVLTAETADRSGFTFGSNYARLPFRVEVPSGLPVEISDGSGEMTVTGLAAVEIDDGSGEINVSDIAGDVDVRDGSGALTIKRVGGSIRVNDGSGSIHIAEVRQDVIIESDGSGSIDIRDVTGSVTIEDDGSGSITVRNVGGDFTLVEDGSGSVSVDRVRGKVSVPRN